MIALAGVLMVASRPGEPVHTVTIGDQRPRPDTPLAPADDTPGELGAPTTIADTPATMPAPRTVPELPTTIPGLPPVREPATTTTGPPSSWIVELPTHDEQAFPDVEYEGHLDGDANFDGGCVWITVTSPDVNWPNRERAIRWSSGYNARFFAPQRGYLLRARGRRRAVLGVRGGPGGLGRDRRAATARDLVPIQHALNQTGSALTLSP